jgi:hypothetical protein
MVAVSAGAVVGIGVAAGVGTGVIVGVGGMGVAVAVGVELGAGVEVTATVAVSVVSRLMLRSGAAPELSAASRPADAPVPAGGVEGSASSCENRQAGPDRAARSNRRAMSLDLMWPVPGLEQAALLLLVLLVGEDAALVEVGEALELRERVHRWASAAQADFDDEVGLAGVDDEIDEERDDANNQADDGPEDTELLLLDHGCRRGSLVREHEALDNIGRYGRIDVLGPVDFDDLNLCGHCSRLLRWIKLDKT